MHEKTKKALQNFCENFNTTEHPIDQKNFFEFVCVAHESGDEEMGKEEFSQICFLGREDHEEQVAKWHEKYNFLISFLGVFLKK